VGVAEMGTGIQNGLETYQYEFVGVMGCNRIPSSPLSRISHVHKLLMIFEDTAGSILEE